MRSLLWFTIIMCGSIVMKAQEADSLKTLELEGIVIKSVRAAEQAPVSQITVSKKEIEKFYAGQDASVVLEQISPSIISFSDAGTSIGNYNQFRLRGIDQTRINVTLNGVPLNDMIDQGVFFSNFSDFGNSLESVQVQRGVGTSTNGVASYAGSVNFESPRLNTADPGVELQFLGGSFDTYRVAGEVNTGKLKNDLAFYSRFTRTLSSGYKDNSGSDSYSFFFSGGHIGQKDVIKITGFAGKTQNDQSYLPVLRSDIDSDPKTNYNHPNDRDDFEQELIQLQYSRILSGSTTLNSTFYYGGARGVFPFGFDNFDSLGNVTGATQLLFGLQNDHYGLTTDVNYESAGLNLSTGIHGYLFDRRNFNSTAPNTSNPDYEDETDKNEFSVFTKASYAIGSLTIFGDIQLRYVNLEFSGGSLPILANVNSANRDWTFFNPKIGANLSINPASSVYASFGRSGREPTRTDILQGDGSAIGDFNVASVLDENIVTEEYVNNLEVGYRYANEKFRGSINYFLMNFEDEISLVGALAARSYVALRQNVDKSRRSGVEFIGDLRINEQLSFGFNGSYTTTNVSSFTNANSDVFEDVEHIFAPTWILSPSLDFRPAEKLGINLNGRYVSESFMELSNDDEFTLPDYFLLNSRLDYSVSNTIQLSVMVNNIFDKLYFNEGSPVDLDFDGVVEGPGYRVQPPRNFYGMLTVRF